MNRKGDVSVSLPWQKVIVYLIIALFFIVMIALLVLWRGMGIDLINYLFK